MTKGGLGMCLILGQGQGHAKTKGRLNFAKLIFQDTQNSKIVKTE